MLKARNKICQKDRKFLLQNVKYQKQNMSDRQKILTTEREHQKENISDRHRKFVSQNIFFPDSET